MSVNETTAQQVREVFKIVDGARHAPSNQFGEWRTYTVLLEILMSFDILTPEEVLDARRQCRSLAFEHAKLPK